MTISVKNFIAQLARATDDPTMVVNTAVDWLGIINDNGSELSPEVLFELQTTIDYSTVDSHTQEIDMSSDDSYEGLSKIKSVYLIDDGDKSFIYTNWTFDRNTSILNLRPSSNDVYVDDVTGAPRPGSYYPTVVINWLGEMPDTEGDGSISMTKPRLNVFKKICIREGTRRILLDHTKLDRYRTLVGRANEYTLLAMIRDMTAEIELDKGKLVNSNTVKVF